MTGIRAQQKHSTRLRIMASAREQLQTRTFDEIGVRDIADGADVAAGTVIASFGSKADVLEALILEDFDVQHRQAQVAAEGVVGCQQRLLAMMSVAVDYYARQPNLLQATMGAAWGPDRQMARRIGEAMGPTMASVESELVAGQRSGELRADISVRFGARMVTECLISSYSLSCQGNHDPEQMQTAIERRLTMLFAGLSVATPATQNAKAA